MSGGRQNQGRFLIEVDAEARTPNLTAPGFETLPGGSSAAETRWIEAAIPASPMPNRWDQAHQLVVSPRQSGFESADAVRYVEPDFEQSFPVRVPEPVTGLERLEPCRIVPPDSNWPTGPFAWHLSDSYSQLAAAREIVGTPPGERLLVGILDTGFDPQHDSLPLHLRLDLARNFTGEGEEGDAVDPASRGYFDNPGHGTATLALLAGGEIEVSGANPFHGFLGGAPHVDVVPIRIADSVVHFSTSAMAQGIRYAADIGCRVLSISMGGVPSRAWAEAVNYAYERGTAIFAAAGNRIGMSPPATLVYPARFERVVGVCGCTSDKTPYYKSGLHTQMHGCFGPAGAMETAITAFTPNMPWAYIGCGGLVNPNGAGTSSATPQAAAAAALWFQQHRPQAAEGWQLVEAVRHAVFSSAEQSTEWGSEWFGNGLLRARDALDIPFNASLSKRPEDRVRFPWLRLLIGFERTEAESPRDQMYETEALQLYLRDPQLPQLVGNADPEFDQLDRNDQRRLLTTLREHPDTSQALRDHLDEVLKKQ